MRLLDRYIIARFIANFIILFVLLFLFASVIDVILQLDRYTSVAGEQTGQDASFIESAWALIRLVADFHAPRLFQFYAYLHGLVAVGAMGFTLAQMYRHKELVAMLAAGISMHRIAAPFLAVTFALSLAQLLNQELILPKVAPLLIRDHDQIGEHSVSQFPVAFTPDGEGHLLQAASFEPPTNTLRWPTILVRDEQGRTVQRIAADSAEWDEQQQGWILTEGRLIELGTENSTGFGEQPIDFYPTSLSPEVLTVRRHGQYATMLSWAKLNEMLRTPGNVDAANLARYKFARFSLIFITLAVMVISLPFFLLREPANLLRQSVWCAAAAITALLGGFIGLNMALPGIPPVVGVFLPPLILLPIALARVLYLKT